MRILIVEDDDVLAQVLTLSLTGHHYAVDVVNDGETGWDYAQTVSYDLIMLDIDLPRLDGLSLCRRLRQQGYHGPMLLLTAKASNADKVAGLDAGADDYVVKPCSTEELCARIRALLRRGDASSSPLLQWGGLCVDPTSYEVTYYGQVVSLSAKEYSLLELFLRSPRRVFSSSVILEHIWAFDDSPGEDTVRAHIKRLRKKLKAAGADDVIETIYGIGYRLKASAKDEPTVEPAPTPASAAIAPAPSSPADQARTLAVDLWEQFKPPTLERLAVLDQAVTALKTDGWSESIRLAAERAAHKLAGSLGMFGFSMGSVVARDLETWLQQATTQPPNVQEVEAGVAHLRQMLQVPAGVLLPDPVAAQPTDWVATPRPTSPLLLAVTADESFAAALIHQAATRGLQTELARTLEQAAARLSHLQPQAVVLHSPRSDPMLDWDSSVALLKGLQSGVPIVVVAPAAGLSDRPQTAHPAVRVWLSAALPMAEIMEVIHDLVRPTRTTARVMTVDDDPLILNTLERILPPWGLEVRALNDPSQFWDMLTLTSPDLLILDIEMPLINGIELCQVVRNDANWNGLPILFLSSRRDAETIRQIYSIGADDYVAKPFTEPELVTRIFNRLERTRLLKHRAEVDLVTGVLNRQQGIKELQRQMRLARLQHQFMGVALLQVDQLKETNLRHGYDTGDQVLHHVASSLQRHLPTDALLMRWDGAVFMVGVRDVPMTVVEQQILQAMQVLRETPLPSLSLPLRVTLSGGLVKFPEHGPELQTLYSLLDRLKTEARASGGDRLLIAS